MALRNDSIILMSDKEDSLLTLPDDGSHAGQTPLHRRLRQFLTSGAIACLPSFLHRNNAHHGSELRPTAYLDALRGIAAWIVFNFHLIWSIGGDPLLPNFTLLTCGPSMVTLFFVISGYALSVSIVASLRRDDPSHFMATLASACYRRWARLFLPVFFATFITAMLLYSNLIVHTPCPAATSIHGQIFDWVVDSIQSSNPFGPVPGFFTPDVFRTKYLYQLWTIPVEYRGSLILFLFAATTNTMTPRKRQMHLFLAIMACTIWGALYAALFLSGFALALSSPLATTSDPPRPSRRQNVLHLSFLVMAVTLLARPKMYHESFGLNEAFPWPLLRPLLPSWFTPGQKVQFYPSIGAVLLLYVLDRNPTLREPLSWRLPQYLGRISFGFYAMHITVIWTWYFGVLAPLRDRGALSEGMLGWCVVYLGTLVVTVLVADRFTAVDQRILGWVGNVKGWAFQ
ncbi:Hypothetical protein D9617_31g063690 [Elsinoe fawcettii]|nr:Hypothetical protein D9617_31g063690 [Elsinoe fawcettii]